MQRGLNDNLPEKYRETKILCECLKIHSLGTVAVRGDKDRSRQISKKYPEVDLHGDEFDGTIWSDDLVCCGVRIEQTPECGRYSPGIFECVHCGKSVRD